LTVDPSTDAIRALAVRLQRKDISMTRPSAVFEEVVSANGKYADDFGGKGKLALPPARRFVILTCIKTGRLDGVAEATAAGRATA
jgi:hypothetical protein